MSESATLLLGQLLNLSEVERLLIADKLWESLTVERKEQMASEITEDQDFQAELELRLASVANGTVELIDGDHVFREARERLRQRRQS
jgi:hypothetical protein